VDCCRHGASICGSGPGGNLVLWAGRCANRRLGRTDPLVGSPRCVMGYGLSSRHTLAPREAHAGRLPGRYSRCAWAQTATGHTPQRPVGAPQHTPLPLSGMMASLPPRIPVRMPFSRNPFQHLGLSKRIDKQPDAQSTGTEGTVIRFPGGSRIFGGCAFPSALATQTVDLLPSRSYVHSVPQRTDPRHCRGLQRP